MNYMDTAEKEKSKLSFVMGELTLDSVFFPENIACIGSWNISTLHQTGRLTQPLREFDNHELNILGVS